MRRGLSCRRRLPPLGRRAPAPVCCERRGQPQNVFAAARRGRRQPHRPYQHRRRARHPGPAVSGREDTPVSPRRHGRSLQALEISRRKRSAQGGARRPAARHCQSVDTDWPAFDFKPTPTGRIILDFLNRRIPAYIETGLNLACVEDVARGHILAAERGRIGEKYILGGENLTLAEMLTRLARDLRLACADASKFLTRLPWPLRLAPKPSRESITQRAPRASLTEVRMARKRMFFDCSQGARRTRFRSTPRSMTGLARAITFFHANGYAHPAQLP